jgi:hypothetical protein
MWPGMMVLELNKVLPEEYTAEPRVHLGTNFEIDVCAYEGYEEFQPRMTSENSAAATATTTWAPPEPTLSVDEELTEQYEYEVLVYDQSRGRQLVAAVEIVSPANKDRPEIRQAFVAKCSALLQKRVCVSIVDLVTTRNFNLYSELLGLIGRTDPIFSPKAPATYAVTCRGRKVRHPGGARPRFETWAYPLIVDQPLPILPIWLPEDLAVSLNLEASYEQACWALRI